MSYVSPKLGAKRLRKLADYLEAVPRSRFDMKTWWCGTKGCMLGHAATGPFRRQLVVRTFTYIDYNEQVVALRSNSDCDGSDAAAALFGLTDDQAYELFVGGQDTIRTPKQAAKACRVMADELEEDADLTSAS